MTQSIDTALVTQFSDMVHMEASQMTSRLKGKVEERKVSNANKFTYERLGDIEPIEVTTRHAPTVAQDVTHTRRGAAMRDFRTTILLDEFDDLQVLIDPEQKYAQRIAASLMKQYDRLCLEAAVSTVLTGKNIDTSVSFATDGGITIAAGGTGLTYDKLVTAAENFLDAEVGTETEETFYMCITGQQHSDLMKEQELTSRDYTGGPSRDGRDYWIDQGRIKRAAGFNIIVFGAGANIANPMIPITSTTRDCIAFATGPMGSGICVGINKDVSLRVDNRPDLNNAKQIQATLFASAIRTEGVRVQKVQCTEV
jgi:hypothetical protein